ATTTLNIGLGAALAASGRQRLNLGISIAGTLTNVIVCFALIPSMGHVGAAWAFLAAEIVMVVPSRLLAGQFIGRLHMFEVVSRPLVAGAAMLFVLSALPNLSLFGGIGTGATIYFLVLMAIGGLSKEDRELIREMIQGVLLRGERTETASTDAAESSDVR
ncbi:MAG TPA: polysaccharide biosynthesis C-terminal domain-containing protein, partial [Thermoplasmata archaeon]|nr:polysaccharide biosynthesis C-terminal domain-containing protein [Thermoplasmata archaeon]